MENESAQGEECQYKVTQNMENSNVAIDFTFMNVQIMASLQGPTEAKFASKQDPSRAFIEVNLKCLGQEKSRDLKKLKYDVKSVMEQLIQTIAYPKTLLTFNLTLV